MPAVKNLNSDYTITNKVSPLANIILATNTVFVQGNLVVGGNATSVSKTDMNITDNIIVLNKGEAGTGVTLGTAGISVDRGLAANVQVVWNESYKKWTLSNDGTTYANISTSTGSGAVALADDPAPQLSGNLDTLNRSIFSSNTAYVRFADNVAINVTSVVPTAITANTVLSAQTPDLGQSGLYTTTVTYGNNELITKKKAVWYSLIM